MTVIVRPRTDLSGTSLLDLPEVHASKTPGEPRSPGHTTGPARKPNLKPTAEPAGLSGSGPTRWIFTRTTTQDPRSRSCCPSLGAHGPSMTTAIGPALGIGLHNEFYRYVPVPWYRGRVGFALRRGRPLLSRPRVRSAPGSWRGPACALVGRIGCEVCLCDPCVPCVPYISRIAMRIAYCVSQLP